MTDISIVTTLYKSELYVNEFYERSLSVIKELQLSYEIIYVDDGSPDNSLEFAIDLTKKDANVKVVEFSRNFGHHKAIMAGLAESKGGFVFLIDSDLEEEPELLKVFWNEIHKEENKDVDVLYGVQAYKRKGAWFEQWSGGIFYPIFNFLVDNKQGKLPVNLLVVRLMKRKYVETLTLIQERDFYFAPTVHDIGFNQKSIAVIKHSTSPTTYNFFRKYNMFINSTLAFTSKPLYFIFYFGILLTLASFVIGFYLLFRKIFFDVGIDGWSSLMISIWFLGGLLICFLGVISLYLLKLFVETKRRPFYIIKNVHQSKS
jgi:putative glycosyltransferase